MSSGGLTVWEAFERVARRFPDRPALVEGAGSATYSELQARAEVLAGDLAARLGTGPRHVGLRFTGAAGLVLSSLAVARADGVSVCLDVREPPERLSGVCADAGVSLVLTDGPVGIEGVDESLVDWEPGPSGAAPGAGETYPCWVAEGEERSQQLSCISYSSGSTGEPKGIMWTHAARLGMAERLGLLVYPDVRVCAFFAGSAGNSDMLAMSLLSGATLVPYPVARLGLAPLPAWLEANAVQGMGLVPTLLRHLLATLPEGCVLPVRKVALYGEGSLWEEVGQLLAHLPEDAQVVNTYGTMETAGGSRFFVDRSSPRGEGRLPAGSPSPGRDLMVAGPDGEALPPGQVGEVVVIGDDLPSGYWQRPSMTEERWRRTDDGRRQFWTGDLGVLGPDGLMVLGRRDHMVKVNGFKVELGAVEAALTSLAGVTAAAAVARPDGEGNLRLVAWVVAGPDQDGRAIRSALAERLPSPSVPDRIVVVDELPKLSNGKVDRQDLARRPVPELEPAVGRDPRVEQICVLFDGVLGRTGTGGDDDFFELGGDSMRAARLAAELEDAGWSTATPALVLEARSPVAILAALTRGGKVAGPAARNPARLLAVRASGGRVPLVVVHDGFSEVMFSRRLADLLGPDQPVYAIEGQQAGGRPAVDRTLPEMAARYVSMIGEKVPDGPVNLFGYSLGGLVAYEMAQQMLTAGRSVPLLTLGDTPLARRAAYSAPPVPARVAEMLRKVPGYGLGPGLRRLEDVARGFIERKSVERERRQVLRYMETGEVVPPRLRAHFAMLDNARVVQGYKPVAYPGDVLLFATAQGEHALAEHWRSHVTGRFDVVRLDAAHTDIMKPGHVEDLAGALELALVAAQGAVSAGGFRAGARPGAGHGAPVSETEDVA